MPRQQNISAENNLTGGLKTEFTGLNFPENACTETYNCVFSRVGNVTRRLGMDYELNYATTTINRTGFAINSYCWNNADAAGLVNIYVVQTGGTLHFYSSSAATFAGPLSTRKLLSTITLSAFSPSGAPSPNIYECQFTTGNGYLFVFHPYLEPFYCTYSSGTITATQITVKIRDTSGIEETGVEDTFRPGSLSADHKYNLSNQGWGKTWRGTSTTNLPLGTGSRAFGTQSGLPIQVGDRVRAYTASSHSGSYMIGVVTSYASTTLTVNVTEFSGTGSLASWTIDPEPTLVQQWVEEIGNYPGNSDVWWYFKTPHTANVLTGSAVQSSTLTSIFSPKDTVSHVTTAAGPSPRGFWILDAFDQRRTAVSGVSGLSDVTSNGNRPTTGAWFQGRVWYTGVNYQGFNEKIYFSQIIEKPSQFGKCYQVNDPTSEERFDLLPSDGGLIVIQGAGTIHKLFSVQNGMLVFSSNGIWFITGSQGIGFTANDYTIVKVSSIRSVSATSFVNVLGYPMWWNEEGIYGVSAGQQGGLVVDSITHSTISSFYEDIPLTSRRYARGDFNPLDYTVQWVYRTTEEGSVTSRYEFDGVLSLNTSTKEPSFYPWVIATGDVPKIHDVKYVQGAGGTDSPGPMFKYLTSAFDSIHSTYVFTFSEERDDNYLDWQTASGLTYNYNSYFVSGYKLHGTGQKKFQPTYVYVYSDNSTNTAYFVQGLWNFANSGNSGKWSSTQGVAIDQDGFRHAYRRFKIRGHGVALQLKISSVGGNPFNIIGWSIYETINAHV